MNVIARVIPNKKLRVSLYIFAGLWLSVIIGFVFFPSKPLIPAVIRQQVTSTILIPSGDKSSIIRDTAKYDPANKLLTFRTVLAQDGTTATIAEQVTPNQFSDIPQYSDRFFEQVGEYQHFDTAVGTVHLLKPKGVSGAAGINTKGTLMFVTPDKALSEDQWRQFFLTIKTLD
jgi:hypothetical protein